MVDILLGLKSRIPKESPCIAHHEIYNDMKEKLKTLKVNEIIVIYGPPGCGKTFMVNNAINACKKYAIVINPVKYKLNTNEIQQMSIRPENVLFVDDIDQLQTMDNTIVNKVLENNRIPVVCTCRFVPKRLMKKKEHVYKYELTAVAVNDVKKWLKTNKYPMKLAQQYQNDMNVFQSRIKLWKQTGWMGHEHHFYKNIDDRIRELPRTSLDFSFTSHVDEPGALSGLIQENMCNFKNISMETISDMTEYLSLSDVYSDHLYNGLCYANRIHQSLFYTSSIVLTRGCKPPKTIKPGQAWTKHINMIARRNKINKFIQRNGYNITPDHIVTFNTLLLLIKRLDVSQVQGYLIETQDVDIFTKLYVVKKITPRVKTQLKEVLKAFQCKR
jgi:hypothetical protein